MKTLHETREEVKKTYRISCLEYLLEGKKYVVEHRRRERSKNSMSHDTDTVYVWESTFGGQYFSSLSDAIAEQNRLIERVLSSTIVSESVVSQEEIDTEIQKETSKPRMKKKLIAVKRKNEEERYK
jgi:hypothetical protein